ncbi:MAG: DUF1573 domain-containing protein [Rubripirellula sp.]
MKKFWLSLLFSAFLGTFCAWGLNYQRFGHRHGQFGPFTLEREVTPANIAAYIVKDVPQGDARVELVGDKDFDFGMMSPGTEGEHSFVLRNIGTDVLTLRLGATTCKCTLGELDTEGLAPGEETEIKLSWTVKPGESEFKQSAQVITNDPENLVLNLGIVGAVVDQVSLVPETWTFGQVATGEDFEFEGTVYNFMDTKMQPSKSSFSASSLTDLAEFEVEEFEPTEQNDGIRGAARQGFRVKVKIGAGLRQGVISQNLMFGFKKLDEEGKVIANDDNADSDDFYIVAPVKGSIVGPLGMIENSKLSEESAGGYLYDFGRIAKDGNMKAKAFVVLKGDERNRTKLSIGSIVPDGTLKATLGEPKSRAGSMVLYPIELELTPGDEPIERMGKNSGDYGIIWIESDNPKVSKMRIAVKFAIEGK